MVSDGDDVASESGAGRPERRPARGRTESGPAASPETEALTISLPIELIDQVRQWASRNEIGLDEQIARLLPGAYLKLDGNGASSRLLRVFAQSRNTNSEIGTTRLARARACGERGAFLQRRSIGSSSNGKALIWSPMHSR